MSTSSPPARNGRRPSVKDVAERAQVSLGTVSNVLNRPERVSAGTRERVDDVEIAAAEVVGDLRAQPLEALLRDRRVDVAPPDPLLRARLADDELILGRAARELARVDCKRAIGHERALFEALFVVSELLVREVVKHVAVVDNAELSQAQRSGRGLMWCHCRGVERVNCTGECADDELPMQK